MFQRPPPASCTDRPCKPRVIRPADPALALAVFLCGLLPSALCRAESAPPAPPAVPAVGVPTGAMVQGLLGLLLIIGLLLITLALLKRWSGKFGGTGTAGMKVISGLSVGTRERILLVEVGDTWLVVGVTASQIRTLHTLPKNSLPELAGSADKPAFAQWLGAVIERKRHER